MDLANPKNVLSLPTTPEPARIVEPESPANHLARLRRAYRDSPKHAKRMEDIINRMWTRRYQYTYEKDLRNG